MALMPLRSLPSTLRHAASIPINVVGNVARMANVSKDAARDHPRSRELAQLLKDGYEPDAPRVRRDPTRVEVVLRRGDLTTVVTSPDPAFAFYLAHRLPRARAATRRDRARRLIGLPARP